MFADDIGLMSQSIGHMRTKMEALVRNGKQVGLKINARKTKEMRVNTKGNAAPVVVENEPLETVRAFTYLGSVVSTTGGADEDVKARIRKSQQAFVILMPVWRARSLSLKTKLRIFASNVMSVLLYGCETWKMSESIKHRLQVFVNRCLRRILGIFWPEKISNRELWARTGQRPVAEEIQRRKWRWIGHVARRGEDDIARRALMWNPQGARRRGRPRGTWRGTCEREMEQIGCTWRELLALAQDRQAWRNIVVALCPSGGEED
jgi:hypothetical protein